MDIPIGGSYLYGIAKEIEAKRAKWLFDGPKGSSGIGILIKTCGLNGLCFFHFTELFMLHLWALRATASHRWGGGQGKRRGRSSKELKSDSNHLVLHEMHPKNRLCLSSAIRTGVFTPQTLMDNERVQKVPRDLL
jgi:hypothetical protein